MRLNSDFKIVKNNNNTYLANIVNGDIFLINDVVEYLLVTLSAHELLRKEELLEIIFSKFDTYNDDYSKDDFIIFINDLIKRGILLK